MSLISSPPAPLILKHLPDLKLPDNACPRRARLQIDLVLLAIEAIDLTSAEAALALAQELELEHLVGGRVHLWQLRSTNPLRRHVQRRAMTLQEAKALVVISCQLARRLTAPIRQLLMAHDQLQQKKLSLDHHFRLSDYLQRFRAHFRARMNHRRATVNAYLLSEEKMNYLAIHLLEQLLFCTGSAGMQRFWCSLFDGELP